MGNVIPSVASLFSPFIVTYTVGLVGEFMHIFELEDNLVALQRDTQILQARVNDLRSQIIIAELKGLQQLEEVGVWIMEVEATQSKVCLLLDATTIEIERLIMCGYCSNNCISTYRYGKEVSAMLLKIRHYLSSEPFRALAIKVPPPPLIEVEIRDTVGLENMLDLTWKRLNEDKVGILGLYGMGGVGKTTLLEQINNKFLEKRNEFHVVISVVVSQDLQIGRIQKEIGKRIGLYSTEWEQKDQQEKAFDINYFLKRKRFVILLDDIWRKVDLQQTGIPLPTKQKYGSKVVFTTRSKNICGRMGADVDMEVSCLDKDNAWELFQRKVRAETLASDPEIPNLAKIVCGKCKGLPLALKVIGETMASKTEVREWQHAITVLGSGAAGYLDYPEIEGEILAILKFSYDDIEDERVKQCFHYCALFPEDYKIEKDRLVDYWICEGIINEDGDRETAKNQGYTIIGALVSACLLMFNTSKEKVIMHDVIRQMALWIASKKENFVVKSGVGLDQMPEAENWNATGRLSLGNNQIKDISSIPHCPNLTTLFLQENKLVTISREFFRSMPMLVVLDLSWNSYLNKLPEEVSNLEALRYLGLAGTALKELPMGLRELIKLRHLDLDFMDDLQSISVVSSLLNLETLKVYASTPLSLESIEYIQLLKKLKVLTVTITEVSVLVRLLSIPRMAKYTQGLYLRGCKAVDGIVLVESLHTLEMDGCYIEDVILDWINTISVCARPSDVSFQNLHSVSISCANGLKDLTWLLFAPLLTTLHVKGPSHDMQEIISKDKAAAIIEEQPNIKPFPRLRMISLNFLRALKSIYWEPLPLEFLKEIVVIQCPRLKSLPFNGESCKNNQIRFVVDKVEQFDAVEWVDQATRDRFFRSREVRP